MFNDIFVLADRDLGRRLAAIPAALTVHAVLAILLVVLPLVRTVDPPRIVAVRDAFLAVPPPPPLPPPPPKGRPGAASRRIRPIAAKAAAESGRLFSPVRIPDGLAEEALSEFGVDGGVDGGIEGGIPGGFLSALFGQILADGLGPVEPPVRAAGEIRAPKLAKRVEPAYPEIARQARVEGLVILEAQTDIYGRVLNIKVLRSIPLLDPAAIDAVRQWVYEPMVVNGRPRGVVFTATVRFALQ